MSLTCSAIFLVPPEQREFVKRVKEETGFIIVQLQHCDEYIKSDVGFPDYALYNVGSAEFVQLIRDAEYVFTDSFHASVFSLLNKKKVSVQFSPMGREL